MIRPARRSLNLTALIAVSVLAVSCGGQKAESPTDSAAPGGGAGTSMTPVQRGEVLAYTNGCHDCHTPGSLYGAPNFELLLSGSDLGWHGPWGVTYARNLTPDAETGLGGWTDDEIVRALRSGVRKDGSPILPPMPWQNFARMSEEDMGALLAYLKSVPAIKHVSPARIPPGQKPTGPVLSFPPPPAWDAPKAAPAS